MHIYWYIHYALLLCVGASVDIGTDLAPAPLPPASVPIWRAFVAGGFGGVVSRTATAPLEKVKILQQVMLIMGNSSKYQHVFSKPPT